MNIPEENSAPAPALDPTQETVRELDTRLEKLPAAERLAWAAAQFGARAAIGTSFQGAGIVALHLAAQRKLALPAFTLDTGLLFSETLALQAELEARWQIRVESLRPDYTLDEQAKLFGDKLWERDPALCCELRKVQPVQDRLETLDCWITGVRREQSETRTDAGILELNKTPSGRWLWKLNPLADWTREQVWAHIREHNLPYNKLHDQGYRSIGCRTCTRAAGAEGDERAGRWTGFGKKECGIHTFLQKQ